MAKATYKGVPNVSLVCSACRSDAAGGGDRCREDDDGWLRGEGGSIVCIVRFSCLLDGRPNINTDNALVRDQTFDIREDAPITRARGSIRDGVLRTEAFDVVLPMAFFNVFFDLELRDARIQAELDTAGHLVGILGGGVDKEQIFEIGRMADAMQGEQVSPLLNLLIPGWTDLYPDERGLCTHISAALTFRSVPAFVFEDVRP